MKKIVFLFTAIVIWVSCNNVARTDTPSNKSVDEQTTEQLAAIANKKQQLIVALKKLEQTINSNNKERIAEVFEFPLSDELFSINIDDHSFNELYQSNGNKVTKTMFLQHFTAIAESIWLPQLKNLFQYIPIDSLTYKDTLVYEAYVKANPCYYSYLIEVYSDTVTLNVNMNSNRTYLPKTSTEDDIPENSDEICEHSLWWIFTFDGNKLHLKSISGAG